MASVVPDGGINYRQYGLALQDKVQQQDNKDHFSNHPFHHLFWLKLLVFNHM